MSRETLMMNWYEDGGVAGGWVVMALMAMFWVLLLGVAIWAAVHLLRREKASTSTSPTPRAILDQRLATGEIDAEQYAQLRRLLDGHSAGSASTDPARP